MTLLKTTEDILNTEKEIINYLNNDWNENDFSQN